MSKTGAGGVTGGGTGWYAGPVLGDAYRGRRSVSAAAGGVPAAATSSSAAKKSSSTAAARLPKTPRPGRARQMFAAVKRAVQ